MRQANSIRPSRTRAAGALALALASLAAVLASLAVAPGVRADALRANAVACRADGDAQKIAALEGRRDTAGAAALARPLVASGACIDLAKGIQVGIDERRAPLLCVRLTGDLSCYWLQAALIDEHPGEKGSSGGARHGGKRH